MFNFKKLLYFLMAAVAFGMLALRGQANITTIMSVAVISIVCSFMMIELLVSSFSPEESLGGGLGFVAGLFAALLAIRVTTPILNLEGSYKTVWELFLLSTSLLAFCSIGARLAVARSFRAGAAREPSSVGGETDGAEQFLEQGGIVKILDTSVIIDGRISDLCETGFIEGVFLVPQFVLLELQHIADSSDSIKRARGRRGLDMLEKIKSMQGISVQITEQDFPKIKEVDSKLVALAQKIGGKVVTNDLNLNKIAVLQGVMVLNINDLCNALKPLVLPGETMSVFVLKEGKEAGQGIAYLDDGTMIVVDDARRSIGKSVEVMVTSILQTTAGRMIFTKLKQLQNSEDLKVMRS